MNPENVFQKTDKGRQEIDKRIHHLDAKRRMLLILVDGRSSAAEIAAKSAHVEGGLGLVQSLWTEGFIEPVTQFAEVPVAAAIPAAAGSEALDALKHKACAAIEKLMGPDGEAIALKLERAHNRDEFIAEVRKARDVLGAFLGAKKADEFWKSMGF